MPPFDMPFDMPPFDMPPFDMPPLGAYPKVVPHDVKDEQVCQQPAVGLHQRRTLQVHRHDAEERARHHPATRLHTGRTRLT